MYPVGTRVDTTRAHYDTSINAIKNAGFIPAEKKLDPPIVWIDGIMFIEEAEKLKHYQRVNKIPCMDYICFKSTLFEELNNLRQKFPRTMNFYPLTYLLPNEYPELQRQHTFICGRKAEAPTWVIKPKNGSCGKGIYFIQSSYEAGNITHPSIAQQMVDPFLLDGYKFDFRLYLLISSLEPFSAYIYKDGVARFCTEPYSPPTKANRDHYFMSLTNTAINIRSSKSPDQFTKRASEVIEKIIKMQPAGKNIWKSIIDLSRKLLASIYPTIIATLPSNGCKKIRNIVHDPDIGEDGTIKSCHSSRRPNTSSSRQRSQSQTRTRLNATTTPRQRPTTRNSKLYANSSTISNTAKKEPQKNTIKNVSNIGNNTTLQNNTTDKKSKENNTSEKVSNTTDNADLTERIKNSIINFSLQSEISQKAPNSITITNSTEKVPNSVAPTNSTEKVPELATPTNSTEKVPDSVAPTNSSEKVPDSVAPTNSSEKVPETNLIEDAFNVEDVSLSPSQHYFQILGIDIIIDSSLQPQLLELNDRPSLSVTVPFESDLKTNLMREAFFHVTADARSLGENSESGWQQILPVTEEGTDIYNDVRKIMSTSSNIKYTGRMPANSPTTRRMVSSGINKNLHYERRQRAAELRESSRGRRFNNYLKASPV